MASVEELEIAKHLLNLGVCKRCSLRLLNNLPNELINFENIDDEFITLKPSEHELKKLNKSNICIICLGCLQEETWKGLFQEDSISRIKEYDTDTFMVSLFIPDCIIIREFCLVKYIESTFPSYCTKGTAYKVNRLSQAFRMSLQRRLEEAFGKKYDQNSMLEVIITFTYDYDMEEVSKMMHLSGAEMKPRQISCNNHKIMARRNIFKILHVTPYDVLKSIFPIPSVISSESVRLTSVEVLHHAIYIAGRYLKFDKKLPSGFDISLGLEKDEHLKHSFSISSWIKAYFSGFFKTSEDNISVESKGFFLKEFRILGLGVPFYIRIADPKLTKISYDEFRILENQCNIINIDNGFICRDLQFTDKSAGDNISLYTRHTPRQIVMICSVKNSIFLDLIIKNLNNKKNVDFVQLSLIHSMIQPRTKYMYWMKAKKIRGSDNLFVVEALFSPGVYFDHFIHNKTTPSFEQLAGATIEVHCIDIIEYDRRWPPIIENPEPPKASEKEMMKKGSVIKVESTEEIIDLKDITPYKNIGLPQFQKFEVPE